MRLVRSLMCLTACLSLIVQSSVVIGMDVEDKQHQPRSILFDTDPGVDDIFALLWLQSLAKQGHAEIVAVTTVAGNVGAQQTFANASRTLVLGGFPQVEVARALATGQQHTDAAHIHGTDGMGQLARTLPPAQHRFSEARASVDVIIEKLSARPDEVTLVAVGPLTNLAAAETKSPGILSKAREVVIMGGAFRHRGNITSRAEFNIHSDPEAAERVFASRGDLVVLPLDVTTQIAFTEAHAQAILKPASNRIIPLFLVDLTRSMTQTSLSYRDTEGVAGFHVHDAATLAYLFYPETLLLRRAAVRAETKGQWTLGQTVIDERHGAKPEPNAWVALQVDATNLLSILSEDLKVLGAE